MDPISQIVIIGGGASKTEDCDRATINHILTTSCVFGINLAYQFYQPITATVYCDSAGEIYSQKHTELNSQPLCLTRYYDIITSSRRVIFSKNNIKYESIIPSIGKNHLAFNSNEIQYTHDFTKGVYVGPRYGLSGVFALSLAMKCLEISGGEIFLLGYDHAISPTTGKSHDFTVAEIGYDYKGLRKKQKFIQDKSKHNSRSLTSQLFDTYLDVSNIKIYNVSSFSTIKTFEKITYDQMSSKLTPQAPQIALRSTIWSILTQYSQI